MYVCCSSLPLPIKGLPLYTTAIYNTVHGFLPVRYLISRAYISSRNGSFQHYFALHGNTISAKRILQCLTRNIASLQALCLNGVCRTDPSITRKCRPASFFLSFFFFFFFFLNYYFVCFFEGRGRGGAERGVGLWSVGPFRDPANGRWLVARGMYHASACIFTQRLILNGESDKLILMHLYRLLAPQIRQFPTSFMESPSPPSPHTHTPPLPPPVPNLRKKLQSKFCNLFGHFWSQIC